MNIDLRGKVAIVTGAGRGIGLEVARTLANEGVITVANLICYLSSDFASYITGTMIDVSGGKLATQIPRIAYEQAVKEGDYEL